MAKYGVEIPIAGFIYVEIEAETKEEAIQKGLGYEWTDDDIQELDSYEKLIEGNVVYTWHYKIDAREIK